MLRLEARLFPRDANDALVDEDERIHGPVRNPWGRQGLENLQTHYRANVGVLGQDGLALLYVDLDGHRALLLSD